MQKNIGKEVLSDHKTANLMPANEWWTYMHDKVMRNLEWVPLTSLHLPQEVLAVELIDLLNVPEDDAALPPQGLGYIWAP